MIVPRVELELPEPTRQIVSNRNRIAFWADEVYKPAVAVLQPTITDINQKIFNFTPVENERDFIHQDLESGNGLAYVDTLDGEPEGFAVFRSFDLSYGGLNLGQLRIGEKITRVLHVKDRGFLPGNRGYHFGTKIVNFAMEYFDSEVVIDRTHNAAARMSIKVQGSTFPFRLIRDQYVSAFYDQFPPAMEILRAFIAGEGLEDKVDLRTGKQANAYEGGRMGRFYIRPEDSRVISFEKVLKEEMQVDRTEGDSVWHLSYVKALHEYGLFGSVIHRMTEPLIGTANLLDKKLPVA